MHYLNVCTKMMALYGARKVESKLAQRKMLGIVNTNLVSMDAIKNRSKDEIHDKCDYCGHSDKRGKHNWPDFGKKCDRCGGMNHFKMVCRSSEASNFKSKLRKRSNRTNRKNVLIGEKYMKLMRLVKVMTTILELRI